MPYKLSMIAVIGLIFAAAFMLIWWSWGRDRLGSDRREQAIAYYEIVTDDSTILKRGEKLYQAACASCHGGNFQGQENWRTPGTDGLLAAPPHDQSGHTWHHPDWILFNIVKYGPGYNVAGYRSRMQGYQDVLSDEEIRSVNSYIAAQWPQDILQNQRAINTNWEAKQNARR